MTSRFVLLSLVLAASQSVPVVSAAQPATAPGLSNPLLAAVRDSLLGRNPRLNKFALLDLKVVDPVRGRGYVVVGYGLCDTVPSARRDYSRDELIGIFAVNDSLNRIWHTFDVHKTVSWMDWVVVIKSITGQAVRVKGESPSYGEGPPESEKRYSWPNDNYHGPKPPSS